MLKRCSSAGCHHEGVQCTELCTVASHIKGQRVKLAVVLRLLQFDDSFMGHIHIVGNDDR